jgi:hypothetical protein
MTCRSALRQRRKSPQSSCHWASASPTHCSACLDDMQCKQFDHRKRSTPHYIGVMEPLTHLQHSNNQKGTQYKMNWMHCPERKSPQSSCHWASASPSHCNTRPRDMANRNRGPPQADTSPQRMTRRSALRQRRKSPQSSCHWASASPSHCNTRPRDMANRNRGPPQADTSPQRMTRRSALRLRRKSPQSSCHSAIAVLIRCSACPHGTACKRLDRQGQRNLDCIDQKEPPIHWNCSDVQNHTRCKLRSTCCQQSTNWGHTHP